MISQASCVDAVAFGMYDRVTDDGVSSISMWVENLPEREIVTLTCNGSSVRLNVVADDVHTHTESGLKAIAQFKELVSDIAGENAPIIIATGCEWSKFHSMMHHALRIS